VHIADVGYFVDAGGPIDREASERTTSVYLPLWAEPMLPQELSSGVCSLRPREPRKCLTAEFTFDREGRRTSVRFYRSTIVSDHRLTYGFVDQVLAEHGIVLPVEHLPGEPPRAVAGGGALTGSGSAAPNEAACGRVAGEDGEGEEPPNDVEGATFAADEELTAHLLRAWELAALLRRRRFARGALRIGSFEPEYRFNADGRLIGASSRPETPSHALVEEYMLAANEAVAGFLIGRRAPAVYRVHEPPDAQRAEALMEQLEELEAPTPPFPAGHAATPEQVAAALRRLSELLPGFCAREGRGRLAFPQLLLRSLKQAVYLPENRGHFGLASSGYLHFTSPIRRYPDLIVHRALCAQLGIGDEPPEGTALAAIAEHCSEMERVAAKVELTADDIALSFLLEQWLGEHGWDTVFDGEIVGLIGAGLFVHFGGCYQGFLPSRRLGDERFYESETGGSLVGTHSGRRWRLGDPVTVRVERIEKVRGRVQLELAGREGERAEKDRQGAGETARRPAGRTRRGRAPARPAPRRRRR